jgi:hypothetical protein
MSIVLKENEKLDKKKVLYIGTDTLKSGSNLCYNADAIRSAETSYGKITGAEKSAKTAADFYNGRAWQVEKPAVGNLKHYAGALVEEYAGITGPIGVEIYVPKQRGQKVDVLADVSTTIDVTVLSLQAGSYAAGVEGEGPSIGVAIQTIDRSTVSGVVQTNLVGLSHENQMSGVGNIKPLGRTTVQLPTAAIWDNFDQGNLLLDLDFKNGGSHGDTSFIDASSTITVAGGVGELLVFTTADNEAAEIQWAVPIEVITGSNPWAFECRVKVSEVTNAQNNGIGLMASSTLAGDQIGDTGSLADVGFLGFQKKEGDPDVYDLVYDEAGQTQNEHDANYFDPIVLNTYITLGMYFNGTTIQGYQDGVATGTAISAADIVAADFPTVDLVPTIAVKAGHADDYTTTIDWIRATQK